MQQAKFLEILRGILISANMTLPEATAATFNTLRRFLPTCGEVAGMDLTELQSLSNWSELPKGVGSNTSRAALRNPTSRTYAGDKWTSAALNRQALIVLADTVAKDEFPTGKLATNDIPWNEIRKSRDRLDSSWQAAVGGWPWALSEDGVSNEVDMGGNIGANEVNEGAEHR